MGIKVGTGGGNVKFYNINLKHGTFVEGAGAEKVTYEAGRAAIEGVPYRFTVSEDEYENQKSLKGNLYLHDPSGGPNMCVSWTLFTEAHGPSSPGLTLLGKIFAADTTKAIEIKPWKAEAGTKLGNIVFEQDTVSVALKQADQTGWPLLKSEVVTTGPQPPPPTASTKPPTSASGAT